MKGYHFYLLFSYNSSYLDLKSQNKRAKNAAASELERALQVYSGGGSSLKGASAQNGGAL